MGHDRSALHTIRTHFMTSGVNSSGARLNTAEDKLWETTGCIVGARGTLRLAREQVVQGITMEVPTRVDTESDEAISAMFPINTDDWSVVSYTPSQTNIILDKSGLMTVVSAANPTNPTGEYTVGREVLSGEGFNTNALYNGDFTFGFTFRSSSLAIAAPAAGVPTLTVSFATEEDKMITIALADNIVGVKNTATTYTTVGGIEQLVSGYPISVRVRCDKVGSDYDVRVFINDVSIGDFNVGASGLGTTDGYFAKVSVSNAAGTPDTFDMHARLTNFFLRDTDSDYLEATPVEAVTSRHHEGELAGSVAPYRYAATKKAMWLDKAYDGMWRPFSTLPFDHASISDFRNSLIICNYGEASATQLFRLQDGSTMSTLNDAPNLRFTVQHNNRCWGAGDKDHKLRLYYSGDRDPNKWFSPETDEDGQESYDEVLSAGYFEIDGVAGDEIRCIQGEYKGAVIVATNRKLFRITGNDLLTWQVEELSDHTGALSHNSMAMVGNDLWIATAYGVVSLEAIQGYGDLATKHVSRDIKDVFMAVGRVPSLRDSAQDSKAWLIFNPETNMAILGVNGTHLLYFSVESQQWYGPIEQEHSCMAMGDNGFPEHKALLTGTPSGTVLADTSRSATVSGATLRSTVLNGRSVDPRVTSMEKTWHNLRLLCNPTGYWEIEIRYKVEDRPWKTKTKMLAGKNLTSIGTDYIVGTSSLHSGEEPHVIDFPLNERGKSIKFEILPKGEDLSIIEMDVEFSADGYEKAGL